MVSGIVEYINFGLITAIKQTKQGTLSTVAHIVRNPVTTARAAALYMDINYYRLKRGSLCNAYKADLKRKR